MGGERPYEFYHTPNARKDFTYAAQPCIIV